MPPHIAFTRNPLRLPALIAHQLRTVGVTPPELALLLFIAALPLMHLSMQISMGALLLIYGPMQTLRSVPYDIRWFIVTHGRVSLAILRTSGLPHRRSTPKRCPALSS